MNIKYLLLTYYGNNSLEEINDTSNTCVVWHYKVGIVIGINRNQVLTTSIYAANYVVYSVYYNCQ